MAAANVPDLKPASDQVFEHFYFAIQAALEGLGVVMGPLVSISAEAGPGFSGQLGPIPAVEAVVPGVHGGDPRATRRALTSDGAARVGRRCGPPGSIREARTVMSGAVLETPALVAGFENVAVVGETVE